MIPKLTAEQVSNIRKHLERVEWEIGYHEKAMDTLVAEKALLESMIEYGTQENNA